MRSLELREDGTEHVVEVIAVRRIHAPMRKVIEGCPCKLTAQVHVPRTVLDQVSELPLTRKKVRCVELISSCKIEHSLPLPRERRVLGIVAQIARRRDSALVRLVPTHVEIEAHDEVLTLAHGNVAE